MNKLEKLTELTTVEDLSAFLEENREALIDELSEYGKCYESDENVRMLAEVFNRGQGVMRSELDEIDTRGLGRWPNQLGFKL